MSLTSTALTGEFISKKEKFSRQCEIIKKSYIKSDHILQAKRNTLKKVNFEGNDCVVKAFSIPHFPQNYSYGTFSKSKAKKSYDNAKKLLELGFHTPAPVGYFEYRSGFKLRASFYICNFAANTETLQTLLDKDDPLSPELIQQFAEFCHRLHLNGVLHRDFNPKNILISEVSGTKQFDLVDINRITWSEPLSLEKSVGSLSRLAFPEPARTLMLDKYATLSGTSLEQCQSLLKRSVWKDQRYFRNKKRFRKIFPKKRK